MKLRLLQAGAHPHTRDSTADLRCASHMTLAHTLRVVQVTGSPWPSADGVWNKQTGIWFSFHFPRPPTADLFGDTWEPLPAPPLWDCEAFPDSSPAERGSAALGVASCCNCAEGCVLAFTREQNRQNSLPEAAGLFSSWRNGGHFDLASLAWIVRKYLQAGIPLTCYHVLRGGARTGLYS